MRKSFRTICIVIIGIVLLVLFSRYVLHRWPYFLYPSQNLLPKIEERFKKPVTERGIDYPLKDRWIKIKKSQRILEFYSENTFLKSYKIVLGRNPVDDKIKEGDKCTPEGEFYICTKNPRSQFYLFLGISYPNKEDAERGLRKGLISRKEYNKIISAIESGQSPPWNTPLGGTIGIHGGGTEGDWTIGCIALANSDIEELYQMLQIGNRVVIEK